eukprot:18994-Eustigmatos_ZCMA.PRE.1
MRCGVCEREACLSARYRGSAGTPADACSSVHCGSEQYGIESRLAIITQGACRVKEGMSTIRAVRGTLSVG